MKRPHPYDDGSEVYPGEMQDILRINEELVNENARLRTEIDTLQELLASFPLAALTVMKNRKETMRMNPNHGMLDDVVALNNKIKKLEDTIEKMAERDVEQREQIARLQQDSLGRMIERAANGGGDDEGCPSLAHRR